MNIKELSKEEVLKLTDEQVKIYVDWNCAVEGVKLLSRPTAPSKDYAIKKGDPAYVLPSVIVKDFAIAEKITKILETAELYKETYDYGGMGYDYKWLKPDETDYLVSKHSYYFQDDIAKVKTSIETYKKNKDQYDKDLGEYEKCEKLRCEINDDIWEYVSSIRGQEQKKNYLLERFEEYKTLAKGDESIAARFLVKAYPEAHELLVLAGMIVLPKPEEKKEEE